MWAGNAWRAALSGVPCGRSAQSVLAQLRGILEGELEGIRGAGTWKSERVITSRQGPHIHVDGVSGGILNVQVCRLFGAGLSSVRFIRGTQSIHKNLEVKIARFHQREDAILYPSCCDANAGVFEALLRPEDAVLSDELNCASIIHCICLCKAHKYRYCHLDKHRRFLVATDGAFSMDGDIVPPQKICRLASRYGALVFVDECHATGFLGLTGQGTDELLGVMGQVTIINSTLGKALGGASGGYTTGPGPLVSLLLPSPTSSPTVCHLLLLAAPLRWKLLDSLSQEPVTPSALGIFVIGFSYPVVSRGKAQIRIQISALHNEEDIDYHVEAFVEVGQLYRALP
uniref:Aminotransferase class I/classII large domain-containing protein n=1 Tax=Gorilla gorilla gorilla TaxID=9595 RepID=A0A2I2ZJZ0_GORGO